MLSSQQTERGQIKVTQTHQVVSGTNVTVNLQGKDRGRKWTLRRLEGGKDGEMGICSHYGPIKWNTGKTEEIQKENN